MGVEWGGRNERRKGGDRRAAWRGGRRKTDDTRREMMSKTTTKCRYCGAPNGPVCDAYECIQKDNDADRLASPEELADMFGVTDLTDIADDLYEQYEDWMEGGGLDGGLDTGLVARDHPTLSGGSWALIEEAGSRASLPKGTGCGPGAPTEGHVGSHSSGSHPAGSEEDR